MPNAADFANFPILGAIAFLTIVCFLLIDQLCKLWTEIQMQQVLIQELQGQLAQAQQHQQQQQVALEIGSRSKVTRAEASFYSVPDPGLDLKHRKVTGCSVELIRREHRATAALSLSLEEVTQLALKLPYLVRAIATSDGRGDNSELMCDVARNEYNRDLSPANAMPAFFSDDPRYLSCRDNEPMINDDNYNDEPRLAFEERNYCVCENLLCELERDRDQNGLDERKLTVNRQLLSLAKSGWTNPDAYASALGRLAPDSSSKMLGDEIRLFNLCVVAFHSGQYKQAMNLAENVLRNDTDLAVVDRDTQLLRIELCLLLQQPQKAMNYLEQLKRSKVYDTSDIFLVNHIRMAEARTYLLLKRYFSFRNHDSKLSENQQWFPALCRAQCDHLTGNPRAALSLLLKASDTYPKDWQLHTAGESKQLVINNAFGCVYASRLRKPHLSLVYFQKALAAIIKKPEVPRPLLACPPTWRYGLLYNMALSLLQAGEPHAAFDCFLSVLQLFHENARLWLRLAECCILAHKSTNRTSFELVERMKEMIKQVIGIGPHRKVILRTNLGRMDGGGEQQTAGSGAIPMVSLEFASLCLRNALALLPAIDDQMLDRAAEMAEKGEQIMENNLPLFPAMPGPPLSVSEVHRIRCSTLCNLAYVSLSLNEVQMALRYSGKLMEQKYLSPAHSLMGRLYMSESSMLTGRVPDAIRLLDPDTVHKLTIPELWAASEAPLVTEWFPNTVPNAKAILIYNLAVVETINGNYQRANEILQQIQTRKEMNPSIQNLILALYVQLKLGNTEFCRALVMRTLPGHGR